MKLFLIERTDEIGYDEYDSHVIAANTPDDVKHFAQWAPYHPSEVKLIGTAAPGTKAGVVHSSFRAG